MLEIQSLIPNADLTCINKRGYAFQQVEHRTDFPRAAKFYNISVYCDSGNQPRLPDIVLVDGIQEKPLPLESDQYDMMMSVYSLNEGAKQKFHC